MVPLILGNPQVGSGIGMKLRNLIVHGGSATSSFRGVPGNAMMLINEGNY